MTTTPTKSESLPELPVPALFVGTKLVPYEQRHFGTRGLREKLGYTESPRDYYTAEQMHEYARLMGTRAEAMAAGWEYMTREARAIQMRHVDNHEGDVYHAMQSLSVKFGRLPNTPMIEAALTREAPQEAVEEALPIVAMLVEVAKAAHYAMDDCGDLLLTEEGAAKLSNALDSLDELPELDDGYVRDGWCKAKDHLAIALDAKVRGQLANRYEQEGFHGIADNLRGAQDAATPPAPQRLAQGEAPSIRSMPFVTIEQVNAYRAESLRVEDQRDALLSKLIDKPAPTQPPHQDRGEVDAFADLIERAEKAVAFLDHPVIADKLHGHGFLPIRSELRNALHAAQKARVTAALTEAKQQGTGEAWTADERPGDNHNWGDFSRTELIELVEALSSDAKVQAVRKWPFVETPGALANRVDMATRNFPLVGALRNVFIENPPTFLVPDAPQVEAKRQTGEGE